MQEHRISAGHLSATILTKGAEPSSIRHDVAGEMLWQAEPAWPKHAPVLFPIVGELPNGEFEHAGHTYALGRHGFARDLDFTWMETGASACTLLLADDAQTRANFPFRFDLQIRYAIENDTFAATFTVGNPGSETLPASIGAHPAFRWPLADGVSKLVHTLEFAQDEPEPIRRLDKNLLDPRRFPTPIAGRILTLDPWLFDADAIVMDGVRSRSLVYSAPGTPALEIAWDGFEQLGLWSKRGGNFVCIEPWYGYASPLGLTGDFVDKPGLMYVAPGASKTFEWRVRVRP